MRLLLDAPHDPAGLREYTASPRRQYLSVGGARHPGMSPISRDEAGEIGTARRARVRIGLPTSDNLNLDRCR